MLETRCGRDTGLICGLALRREKGGEMRRKRSGEPKPVWATQIQCGFGMGEGNSHRMANLFDLWVPGESQSPSSPRRAIPVPERQKRTCGRWSIKQAYHPRTATLPPCDWSAVVAVFTHTWQLVLLVSLYAWPFASSTSSRFYPEFGLQYLSIQLRSLPNPYPCSRSPRSVFCPAHRFQAKIGWGGCGLREQSLLHRF